MIGFIALSAHLATAYLHFLLAWRFYPQRRKDFFVYVFWLLMVVSCLLHVIYTTAFIMIAIEAEDYIWHIFLAGYWVLAIVPALLAVLFLGELSEPPKRNNILAAVLIHISKDQKRLFIICLALALMTILWSLNTILPFSDWRGHFGNLYALLYLSVFAGVWLLMLISGLRPAKEAYNFLTPMFRFVMVFLVVMSLLTYFFDLGNAWSLIPIGSTVGLSLCFCWYRFRTQFMDVILNQFVQIIMAVGIVAVLSITVDWMHSNNFSVRIRLLTLLTFVILAWLLYKWLTLKMEAFWHPPTSQLARIHSELPALLAQCTDADGSIRQTEKFLEELFLTKVSINKPLAKSVQTLDFNSQPYLKINLGYLRRWMPWFSEALNWIRIAGLYLQGHLKVLQTLKQEHDQKLKTEALTGLAAKAELNAMRSQIRPHFLFNILNSIHNFITTDPKQAELTIEMLAGLMRGVLQMSDKDEVELTQELSMVEKYLMIEKIRYGDQFQYDIDVDSACSSLKVPAFSIQPLVENAIKHAVDMQIEPVNIQVRAHMQASHLIIQIIDDGPGLARKKALTPNVSGLGMALENIETRLKKLYGEQGEFNLTNRETKGVIATIKVPQYEKK